MMVPGTRESLDEDSITSYILQDEAMQKAEQPTELLPQANHAAPTKLNQQQGQRGKPGGGGSGGWRGLPSGGGSCAGQPDGDAARQRVLPPPDGDEDGLCRHGAVRKCEARAWLQWGVAACRGSWNRRSARGGSEAGPHPRRALLSGSTGEPAVSWPTGGERSAAAGRRRRDAARRCHRGGARSSTLHRMSALHRPLPLLNTVAVDRGGGSADDRLGNEVDP
ncbi:unnamed protein product [Closterium sp. NIES-54]